MSCVGIPALNTIFLQPGEHFMGDASCRIRTLLGSCVSITLWHPVRRVGAMSHFLLPSRSRPHDGDLNGHYGDESLWILLQELADIEVMPTQCVGKIFGGGEMFPGQARSANPSVGTLNGEAARALLRSHRIPIVAESLFGLGHRQIFFDIGSGNVWARQVKPVDPHLGPAQEQMP